MFVDLYHPDLDASIPVKVPESAVRVLLKSGWSEKPQDSAPEAPEEPIEDENDFPKDLL